MPIPIQIQTTKRGYCMRHSVEKTLPFARTVMIDAVEAVAAAFAVVFRKIKRILWNI